MIRAACWLLLNIKCVVWFCGGNKVRELDDDDTLEMYRRLDTVHNTDVNLTFSKIVACR